MNEIRPAGKLEVNIRRIFRNLRTKKNCIITDIKRFYNILRIDKNYFPYQPILFKPSEEYKGERETHVLRHLFYGVKSAGSLCGEAAINKIIEEEKCKTCEGDDKCNKLNHLLPYILRSCRYVDDITASIDKDLVCKEVMDYVSKTLSRYQLFPKKWYRNGQDKMRIEIMARTMKCCKYIQ